MQVIQDPVDDVLVLDASDDFDRSTAATTDLDVDTEHTFQALGPGHTRQSGAGSGGMALGGCADFCVGVGLDASPAPGRRHEPASAMVRREDAMITGEIDPRLWYQGC